LVSFEECSVFVYVCRNREIDILEKKLEQQCQQLETANADKENLERECERLKNERMVCVVQKNI
jgi:hypothetical protein